MGDHKNFMLQGMEVKANKPIVDISTPSRVNHMNKVESIRYKGIPLIIPMKNIEIRFFLK
jgi:hypothetical protein